jgi:peroxiredoxin
MRLDRTVLVTMVAVALAATTRADTLKLGDKAPKADLKMKGVDGKEVSIAEVAGKKGTLVIFTCNHCPFVKAWETRIAEIGNAAVKNGIGVIAINPNDPAEFAEDSYDQMQARAKQRGFQFAYVVDATSDVARAFGASRTPEIFLFDANGKLVYHGAVDDNKDAKNVDKHYLSDAIEAVADGKPVAVSETKAVGCSIKFRPKA